MSNNQNQKKEQQSLIPYILYNYEYYQEGAKMFASIVQRLHREKGPITILKNPDSGKEPYYILCTPQIRVSEREYNEITEAFKRLCGYRQIEYAPSKFDISLARDWDKISFKDGSEIPYEDMGAIMGTPVVNVSQVVKEVSPVTTNNTTEIYTKKWNNSLPSYGDIFIAREVPYSTLMNRPQPVYELVETRMSEQQGPDTKEQYEKHQAYLQKKEKEKKEQEQLLQKAEKGETFRQFRSFDDFHEFIAVYEKAAKSGTNTWNEVLTPKARIVLDFDAKKGERPYNEIIKRYQLENHIPVGYKPYLQSLVLRAFLAMGLTEIHNELSKSEVKWITLQNKDGTNTEVIAPPFCWMDHCREDKISFHLILPLYSRQRHVVTKHLLATMTMLALDDGWKCFRREIIGDTAYIKEQQNIRMAKMAKHGVEGCLRVWNTRHFPHCVYATIPHYLVPRIPEVFQLDRYTLSSPYTRFFFEEKGLDPLNCTALGEPNQWWRRIKEQSTDPILGKLSEHYTRIEQTEDKKGRTIYHLVPKAQSPNEWYCPVCDKTHGTCKPFLCGVGNNVYVTCSRKYAHKGKALHIGKVHREEEENINESVRAVINSWIYPVQDHPLLDSQVVKYEDKRCREFLPMNQWETLLICSEKGTGKTHQLGAFLQSVPKEMPICIISFRKSLLSEQISKYGLFDLGFTSYQNGSEWLDKKRVITTVESLHKWKEIPQEKSDCLVVIDESESMLTQLDSDTVRCKKTTLSTFSSLIKNSSHVLCLDAGLTWNVTGSILQLYGREVGGMRLMQNTIRLNNCKEKTVTLYDSKEKWIGELSKEPAGTKIDIRTGLHASQIASQVQQIRNLTSEQVVVITGDIGNKGGNVNDTYDNGEKAELCVVNSAHQAGNSYDKEYFDVLYTFGEGNTAGPLGLLQMEYRVRNHKRGDIHACLYNARQEWYKLSLARYKDHMDRSYDTPDQFLSQEEMDWKYKFSLEDQLVLSLIRVRDAVTRDWMRETYALYHENVHGYKVEYDYSGRDTKALKKAWKEEISNQKEAIKECTDKNEKKRLQEALKKTKEQVKEIVAESKTELCAVEIPKSNISVDWEETIKVFVEVEKTFEPYMMDDDRIDRIIDTIFKDKENNYVLEYQKKMVTEMYWYSKVLSRRGYDLTWKHAERVFYDQWNRGGDERVRTIIIMKSEIGTYSDRVKALQSDHARCEASGEVLLFRKNPTDDGTKVTKENIPALVMPEGGRGRNAVVRYRLLLQLFSYAVSVVENDRLYLRYRPGVRNNEKFKKLCERIDRQFDSGLLKRGECHHNLWKKISHILQHQYCIYHKMETYQTRKYGPQEMINEYSFEAVDTLVDMSNSQS